MNNKEYLFEAIGDMDDDLIDDAAVMKPKRKLWPLVAAAACAAAMLLVILSAVNDQPDPVAPAQLHTAENLWLKQHFPYRIRQWKDRLCLTQPAITASIF